MYNNDVKSRSSPMMALPDPCSLTMDTYIYAY